RGPERMRAGKVGNVDVDEGEVDISALEQGKAVAAIVGGADPEWQLGRLYRVHEDLPDEARIVRDQHADGLLHRYSLRLPRVTLDGSPTGSHGSGSGILISEGENACDKLYSSCPERVAGTPAPGEGRQRGRYERRLRPL